MLFSTRLQKEPVIVLDGGLSTMLELAGHDLSDDLWSARLLVDDPAAIVEAHRRFLVAGAQVVISASYQASVEGLVAAGHSPVDACELIASATRLAQEAVDSIGIGSVAASVGPYGAYLADGSEYTGSYPVDRRELARFHGGRLEILVNSHPDLLACETIPCIDEAIALAAVLDGCGLEAWVTFSCSADGRTCSGEDLAEAVTAVVKTPEVVAVGVNCTAPDDVDAALQRARTATDLPLIVYPNSGRTWDGAARRWRGVSMPWIGSGYLDRWLAAGVRAVGGCCGTDDSAIAGLASYLAPDASTTKSSR